MKNTLLAICAAALVGCSITKQITPAIVEQGATALTAAGAKQYPEIVPGLQAAAAIICSDANATNLNPVQVVADIQQINPSLNTPTAILVENGVMALYIGVWDSYGESAVTNNPAIQSYLQAVCIGMQAGLPTAAMKVSREVNPWPVIVPK